MHTQTDNVSTAGNSAFGHSPTIRGKPANPRSHLTKRYGLSSWTNTRNTEVLLRNSGAFAVMVHGDCTHVQLCARQASNNGLGKDGEAVEWVLLFECECACSHQLVAPMTLLQEPPTPFSVGDIKSPDSTLGSIRIAPHTRAARSYSVRS